MKFSAQVPSLVRNKMIRFRAWEGGPPVLILCTDVRWIIILKLVLYRSSGGTFIFSLLGEEIVPSESPALMSGTPLSILYSLAAFKRNLKTHLFSSPTVADVTFLLYHVLQVFSHIIPHKILRNLLAYWRVTVCVGPGLVFVVYPAAIARMPGSPVWAALFFVFLFTVGVDSQVSTVSSQLKLCKWHSYSIGYHWYDIVGSDDWSFTLDTVEPWCDSGAVE